MSHLANIVALLVCVAHSRSSLFAHSSRSLHPPPAAVAFVPLAPPARGSSSTSQKEKTTCCWQSGEESSRFARRPTYKYSRSARACALTMLLICSLVRLRCIRPRRRLPHSLSRLRRDLKSRLRQKEKPPTRVVFLFGGEGEI